MRLFVLAAVLLAAPACAQQGAAPQGAMPAAPACATMDANLPADLKDWNGGAKLASATSATDAGKSALTIGKGYEAALLKTLQISYPVQPEKPGGSVSSGGLFEFTVASAGNYTVAQSTPAWIDVIEDGKALSPTTFGHGPECTSIRKMVVFPLKAGKHTLQISGNGAPTMKIMVAKKP